MLISTEAVYGVALDNETGAVGTVRDLFFDDQTWSIRYLVVETGNWLTGRQVLLPPAVVEQRDWAKRRLWVPLTQQQIGEIPEVDTDKPISLQKRAVLDQYPVWAPMSGLPYVPPPAVSGPSEEGDPHLRSAREVSGYHIEADDGVIGHVRELIIDDEAPSQTWEARYLIVDTGNWLPGKQVLISPEWTRLVSWEDKKVVVDLSREKIKDCPEFNPTEPINRRYEEILFDYYGKPVYWLGHSDTTVER